MKMKKAIFSFIAMTILTIPLYGQITILETPQKEVIGSYTSGRVLQMELARVITEADTSYTLTFSDQSYTHIHEYKTIDIPDTETMIQFRDIIMSVFETPNNRDQEYKVSFKLGNPSDETLPLITVSTNRIMGTTMALIVKSGAYGGFHQATQRHIQRVFANTQ